MVKSSVLRSSSAIHCIVGEISSSRLGLSGQEGEGMLSEHCSLVTGRITEPKRAIDSTTSDRPFQSRLPFSPSVCAYTVSAITTSAASLAPLGELGTSSMAGSISLSGRRDTLIFPFVRFQDNRDLIRSCDGWNGGLSQC